MAITTLAQLQNAKQQSVTLTTNTSAGNSGVVFNSRFASTGDPSGTLAGTDTTSGIVPTSASAGYPRIRKFGTGNSGYIEIIRTSKDMEGRIAVFDRLWVAGAYAFNASTTLSSQPSFASRVPNGDYSGLEIWVEIVTNFTGNPTFTIGYTNESGTNSRSTSLALTLNPQTPRVFAMPLQSGDSGVQTINSVACTVATVGTFNVMVLRRLGDFWIRDATVIDDVTMFDDFVLQPIYDTSALYVMSTSAVGFLGTGLPRVQVHIAEG